jgi:hypothetical protein
VQRDDDSRPPRACQQARQLAVAADLATSLLTSVAGCASRRDTSAGERNAQRDRDRASEVDAQPDAVGTLVDAMIEDPEGDFVELLAAR